MEYSPCTWMRSLSSKCVPAESTSRDARPSITAEELVRAEGAQLRMGTTECSPTAAASPDLLAWRQADAVAARLTLHGMLWLSDSRASPRPDQAKVHCCLPAALAARCAATWRLWCTSSQRSIHGPLMVVSKSRSSACNIEGITALLRWRVSATDGDTQMTTSALKYHAA